MGEQLELFNREPVWCHTCGHYSWAEDWGSAYALPGFALPDICPVCGGVSPAGPGPLTADGAAEWAAAERAEVW